MRNRARAEAAASEDPAGGRTRAQLRADALVELICRRGEADDPGERVATWQGRDATVHVTVALSTLLLLDQQPGLLDGHGPIPAWQAIRVAADPSSTWRRLLLDDLTGPPGRLVDVSARSYRPPQAMTDFVIARDQVCSVPGCARPARRCELDHCTPWAVGGQTRPGNLHPLCSRHHQMKHETTWDDTLDPDGTTPWRSPTGHRYGKPSPELPRDVTAHPHEHDPPPF